jgi:hypothetical protein
MRVAGWVEWMDDRFGHLAIPHVTRFLVALNLTTYLLDGMSPGFVDLLVLDRAAILSGEVWRLFTFIMVPATRAGPIWFFIFLWFTWIVGESLESEWGPAKINLFYLLGMIGLGLVSVTLVSGPIRNDLLITSLILPFGTVFPKRSILLMFILPIEARWISIVYGGWIFLTFVFSDMAMRAVILGSVINYLLFFVPSFYSHLREEAALKERRRRFEGDRKS